MTSDAYRARVELEARGLYATILSSRRATITSGNETFVSDVLAMLDRLLRGESLTDPPDA